MEFNYEGKEKVAELLINCYNNKYVVFYANELIAIPLENSFIKKINGELKKKLKEEGVGFFKRLGKVSEYWNSYGERFSYMDLDQIMAEHGKAKRIAYSDITKCRVSSFVKDGSVNDGDIEDKEGDLQIKSKDAKFSFEHKYTINNEDYKKMVNILNEKSVNAKKDLEI